MTKKEGEEVKRGDEVRSLLVSLFLPPLTLFSLICSLCNPPSADRVLCVWRKHDRRRIQAEYRSIRLGPFDEQQTLRAPFPSPPGPSPLTLLLPSDRNARPHGNSHRPCSRQGMNGLKREKENFRVGNLRIRTSQRFLLSFFPFCRYALVSTTHSHAFLLRSGVFRQRETKRFSPNFLPPDTAAPLSSYSALLSS
jgi:hypothetical protein